MTPLTSYLSVISKREEKGRRGGEREGRGRGGGKRKEREEKRREDEGSQFHRPTSGIFGGEGESGACKSGRDGATGLLQGKNARRGRGVL
jgi:hypothetical protein